MQLPSQDRSQRPTVFWFLALLSLSHAVVDLSAGALIALLPRLREQFSLSYTMVGNIMLFSTLTSSVTQPIFGWISDHSKQRWLVPLSLVLSGAGLAFVGFMPSYGLVLAAVVLSALGSASFHPEGAHAAHNLGGNRQGRALAIYSVGGNLGYALGTIYGALLISLAPALQGTAYGVILPGFLALLVIRLLPRWRRLEEEHAPNRDLPKENRPATNWTGTVMTTLVVIVRSIIVLGVASYIPFYWIDYLGNAPGTAVYVQLIYLLSGVFGTMFGALLADRIGTKRLLPVSFCVLFPLQMLLPVTSGLVMLIVLFAAGFVGASTFTTTLLMTQRYMPRSLGLAAGINLGLAFGMGGVGTMVLGMVTDRWGVITGLWTVAALVPVALLLTLLLPKAPKES